MPTGVYKRTPEHNAANSKAHKGIKRAPEHCDALSKAQIGHSVSEKTRAKISNALKGVPKPPRTSEHCAAMSRSQKGIPKLPRTPEDIAAIKKGQEESGMFDVMRGGNDIVKHHYLYDHSDLSLNTVSMTRSDHSKFHRLLQKLGYIVPHINITEE